MESGQNFSHLCSHHLGDVTSSSRFNGLHVLIPVSIFLMIFGLFPNALVVFLVMTRKFLRERYVMNACIAISHIMYCTLTYQLLITHHVILDKHSARTCEFFVCCIVGVTSLTMAVTAVRRALALSEKFRYKLGEFSFRNKLTAITVIWIVSVIISIPFVFDVCAEQSPFSVLTDHCNLNNTSLHQTIGSTEITEGTKVLRVICSSLRKENGLNLDNNTCYVYSSFLAISLLYFASFLSFLLQGYGYWCIRHRPNQKLWTKELMLTKQHLWMIIIFIVCLTPLTIINLLNSKINQSCSLKYSFQVLFAAFSICNPMIYYIYNQNMRQECIKWLKSVFPIRTENTSDLCF